MGKKSTIRKLRKLYALMGMRGVLLPYRHKLAIRAREISVTVLGIEAPIALRLKTTDVGSFRQVFVDRGYEFELVTQPKVILDAGANIGLVSVFLANQFPEATVIAVEPEASNFAVLKRNAAPYGSRIIPVQAALWGENTSIHLVDPGLGNWGFQTRRDTDGEALPRHRVQALTVDRIMEEHGLDFIDIAKVDIEGAEKEVFADVSAWIGKAGMLIVELHDRQKVGCNRSFYNATAGFELEWHHGENVCVARHASDLSEAYRVRAMKGVIA